MQFSYTDYRDEIAVLSNESQVSKHNNQEANLVILKSNQGYIDIDIIENETKSGVFGLRRSFISDVNKVIDRFCEEYIIAKKKLSPLVYDALGA
jgi:C4-type Zn-finger protein